jgi:hypothetical protein
MKKLLFYLIIFVQLSLYGAQPNTFLPLVVDKIELVADGEIDKKAVDDLMFSCEHFNKPLYNRLKNFSQTQKKIVKEEERKVLIKKAVALLIDSRSADNLMFRYQYFNKSLYNKLTNCLQRQKTFYKPFSNCKEVSFCAQRHVDEIQDVLSVFCRLKEFMNIESKVDLFYTKEHERFPAFYYSIFQYVVVTDNFFKFTWAYQIFTLVHELTHAQQHKKYGIRFSYRSEKECNVAYETDADTNAINSINCHSCSGSVAFSRKHVDDSFLAKQGYLSCKDILEMSKNKSKELCDGHKKLRAGKEPNLLDFLSTVRPGQTSIEQWLKNK